jgi:hypothetical protein
VVRRSLILAAALASGGFSMADDVPLANAEADAYAIEQVTLPPDVVLEVGGLEWLPDDRLAVATRRGEIWIASGAGGAAPSWRRFASGLHEVLGLAWREGWLYVTQFPEVTRLRDTDGDGEADVFETVSDGWGLSGDHHEYAFGSKFDRDGGLWVVLCLTASDRSDALFRGWAVRITPDGRMVPTACGIRSPGGIGFDADGNVLYTDNQGFWNGCCSLRQLVRGDFVGHPASLKWHDRAPSMGPQPQPPQSGSRWAAETKRIPTLRPPAVMFPYGVMGGSAAGVACDTTGGAFGPFAGQVFVCDHAHSMLMRCFLETVDGVLQGACFKVREGLRSGSLTLQFAPDGSLYVGGTNRGWGSRGAGDFALERVTWTGRTPFEIRAIRAVTGGFELEFTHPVDLVTSADPQSYGARGFTYIYQSGYGSPEVDDEPCPIEKAEPTADGRRVRLTLGNVREGMIHEIRAPGVRAAATAGDAAGQPLLHPTGWYTLNRLP